MHFSDSKYIDRIGKMLFTFTAHHRVDESEREHARDEEEHRHVTLGGLGRRGATHSWRPGWWPGIFTRPRGTRFTLEGCVRKSTHLLL